MYKKHGSAMVCVQRNKYLFVGYNIYIKVPWYYYFVSLTPWFYCIHRLNIILYEC